MSLSSFDENSVTLASKRVSAEGNATPETVNLLLYQDG
jgi:hypothetical protein